MSLGKLYLTSNLKDELVCIDLATDKIDWRRHYDGGYADSQAITPDGKTLYVPMRGSDSWWAIDAAEQVTLKRRSRPSMAKTTPITPLVVSDRTTPG